MSLFFVAHALFLFKLISPFQCFISEFEAESWKEKVKLANQLLFLGRNVNFSPIFAFLPDMSGFGKPGRKSSNRGLFFSMYVRLFVEAEILIVNRWRLSILNHVKW